MIIRRNWQFCVDSLRNGYSGVFEVADYESQNSKCPIQYVKSSDTGGSATCIIVSEACYVFRVTFCGQFSFPARREFFMEILYNNIAIIAIQHSKINFVDTFGDFSHTVEWNSLKSVWQISLYILAQIPCVEGSNYHTVWQKPPHSVLIFFCVYQCCKICYIRMAIFTTLRD